VSIFKNRHIFGVLLTLHVD